MHDAAEELDRLAVRALAAREAVEAHRTALGRYALVWWSGEAAERYWAHVEARGAALAQCADGLDVLADAASGLALLVRAETGLLGSLGVAA